MLGLVLPVAHVSHQIAVQIDHLDPVDGHGFPLIGGRSHRFAAGTTVEIHGSSVSRERQASEVLDSIPGLTVEGVADSSEQRRRRPGPEPHRKDSREVKWFWVASDLSRFVHVYRPALADAFAVFLEQFLDVLGRLRAVIHEAHRADTRVLELV